MARGIILLLQLDCGIPWWVQESKATGFLQATGILEASGQRMDAEKWPPLLAPMDLLSQMSNTKWALSTKLDINILLFPQPIPWDYLSHFLSISSLWTHFLQYSPSNCFFLGFHPQLTAEWSHPILVLIITLCWFQNMYSIPEHLSFRFLYTAMYWMVSQFRYPTRSYNTSCP